jgi:hypothetical protein
MQFRPMVITGWLRASYTVADVMRARKILKATSRFLACNERRRWSDGG